MREGKTIAASLEHVIYYPSKTADRYPTVVTLHGRGTDELDLIPLIPTMGFRDVLVISPRAPRTFEYGVGFAWYDLGQELVPRPQTIRESLGRLSRFISEIKTGYPVDNRRIVLLGFSQGAVMVYALTLTEPSDFLGMAALSGYIPQRSGLSFHLNPLSGVPAFVSHGTYDQIIPVQLARESVEFLRSVGANVEYREYPMAHEVREQTLYDLGAWMRELLRV